MLGKTRTVCQKVHSIPVKLREGVKREIDSLLSQGIIEESDSHWSSPLVPVPKPDDKIRLCIDYRPLHQITPLLRTWISSLDEILDKAGHAHVMSKLDLSKGYYQLQMDPASKDMTTFVCPYGKYRFVRMPFGLKNAPAMFQHAISTVLKRFTSFSTNYIDDILVYSGSWKEHLVHLDKVLRPH